MEDLFVNFIGAVTFSIVGISIQAPGQGKLAGFHPDPQRAGGQDPAAPDSSQENIK